MFRIRRNSTSKRVKIIETALKELATNLRLKESRIVELESKVTKLEKQVIGKEDG